MHDAPLLKPAKHVRILGTIAYVLAALPPLLVGMMHRNLLLGVLSMFMYSLVAIGFGALLHAAADNREAIHRLEVNLARSMKGAESED